MTEAITSSSDPVTISVLPLRDVVIYPNIVMPLFVGRKKSINALEVASENDESVLLLAQRDPAVDDPDPANSELYKIGTLGKVLQCLKLPDGTRKVLVEGMRRVEVDHFVDTGDILYASVKDYESAEFSGERADALIKFVLDEFENYVKINQKIPAEVMDVVSKAETPGRLINLLASHLIGQSVQKRQEILEIKDDERRLELIIELIMTDVEVLRLDRQVRDRVKNQMEKSQREYYLNEQMKAIQKELGDSTGEGKSEFDELSEKIAKSGMSKEARGKCEGELKKLSMMSPMSAEATVVRNYIDWLLSVPWKKRSRIHKNLNEAQNVLDDDHYGLEKVKERILEYLAVQQRVRKIKGPILCLVGPPGVGKTSLGKSVARATNRKFIRMSLGGVRDEAEIRGHRRTYVGSLPGKIIQNLAKCKHKNPLFMLDEVDKMSMDFRGDPSSALLEVLDPEQNHTFGDHYLEVDYDLSEVMFVATANTLNIPPPLRDRMEIIRISGYTEDEKIQIATKYLMPKQLENNGLEKSEISISRGALIDIVRYYTREAGVRSLEREIAKICRKVAKQLLLEDKRKGAVKIKPSNIGKYLGVRQHQYGLADKPNQVGQVTGLAWTSTGGDLLVVESVVVPGKGNQQFTGKLGNVMQESIKAAVSVVRSRAKQYGIRKDFYQKTDIHVHVPDGATPKDGPSAGVAMSIAIISALTKIPVRADVAMTGEITLRGEILQIGGLKEKLLAAHRGGIKKVLIPTENAKDLVEIPKKIKNSLEIVPVQWIDEVIEHSLETAPRPKPGAKAAAPLPVDLESDGGKDIGEGIVTH